MWAGGRVSTIAPLRTGASALRRSRVVSEQLKTGRSGALRFVSVGHEIRQGETLCVRERHDVVYREAADATSTNGAEPETAQPPTAEEWSLETTPPLLFRFSALTYNAHRIHYDRDFATGVEGYPGLLVHGPLQALMMAEVARRSGIDTTSGVTCDYRLVSPLFDGEGLVAGPGGPVEEGTSWQIRSASGRVSARAVIRTGAAVSR